MAQNYGIPASSEHHSRAPARPAARYLVLIDSAADGARLARLFSAQHALLAEFEGSAPEVVAMIDGQAAQGDARAGAWDAPLAGHTPDERATAQVFHLDI